MLHRRYFHELPAHRCLISCGSTYVKNNQSLDRDSQRAIDLYRSGDRSAAKIHCQRVLKRNAVHFNALQIMAMTLRAEEKFGAAVEYYKKAVKVTPFAALKNQMMVELAVCHQECNQGEIALDLLEQVINADMTNALALHRKGVILRTRGEEQAALECFKQVVTYPPEVSTGAEITRGKAHWYIMTSPTLKPLPGDIEQAETDLSWLKDEEEITNLRFALYNGYERLAQYKKAWHSLKLANQRVWSQVNFNPQVLNDSLNRVYRQIKQSGPTSAQLQNVYRPVFIAGLPRSGTTLLESVLLEHPSVSSRGESQQVAHIFHESIGEDFGLAAVESQQLKAFSTKLERALFKKASSTDVIIEKTPNNFLFAHLLIQAFAGVKIIHTVKEPLEACFSIYRQHFLKQQQQAYSYDLLSTVLYYRWHEKIIELLQQRFPDSVFNIDYNDMIDTGSTVWPGLFRFCGLEWNDAYLEFYRSKREVKSTSASQVRQGISNDYRSRATRYGSIINELKNLLSMELPELLRQKADTSE